MQHATFRFYAELNDFLPETWRHTRITHDFEESISIGNMIEGLGIPKAEIDLVLVNGESVDFTYQVQDGDRVTVYPVFETFDVSAAVRVRPHPLRETRFVLDVRLGRLASYLRLLGFDAVLSKESSDEDLAAISLKENRIVLTGDSTVMEKGEITHGYWVRTSRPRRQAAEVIRRFHLQGQIAPFGRCPRCNEVLRTRKRRGVACGVSGGTHERCDSLDRCPACAHAYGRGAHAERLRKLLRRIVEEAR
jgi:hypothetical protein